jgi:RNA polymerase sigma factor (sigma-70 family)
MMEAGSPNARQVAEAVLLDPQQRSRLLGFAWTRFGIAGADAEDLLQDTAVELLRQRGYVRNPDGFAFAVFRARCGHFLDARRRRRELFGEWSGDTEPAAAGAEGETTERRVALREALNGISSTCRRLIAAYYFEGRSLNEAARTLTLTYDVVSRRISRCLQRLRACLN